MLRAIFIALLGFSTSAICAGESECSKLAARVDGPENNFRPPLEATVIGNGKLFFYNAPSVRCRIKGAFIIKGDSLTVYKPYEDWVNVMFIAKDGEDFIGWVPGNRVKVIGQYGRNP